MTFFLLLLLQRLTKIDYGYVHLALDWAFPDSGKVFVSDAKGRVKEFDYDWRSTPEHKRNAERVMRLFRSW